jgi:hypothetical protein
MENEDSQIDIEKLKKTFKEKSTQLKISPPKNIKLNNN